MELLRHNPSNPITVGIWRIAWRGGTAIRKVISGTRPQVHPDWTASDEPARFDSWRREALAYEQDLPSRFGPDLRGPRLLRQRSLASGDVELVLEEVHGVTGRDLRPADYEGLAERLGAAQGRLAVDLSWRALPWLSRGFLEDYTASKHVRPELLLDDRAWAVPLCREQWPRELRGALTRLHAERDALLALAARAPRTLCHLDLWANNVVVPSDGAPVLVDWGSAGDGALGEDLGNLIAEAVLDLYLPASTLPDLDATLFGAYLRGLGRSGWAGDARDVRVGMCASAVKWHWMGPLHLERALTGGHHVYGGGDDPHPERQYRERGAALLFLSRWADEALAT